MIDQIVKSLIDPTFMIALVVAAAVFVTMFTALPALGGNPLRTRMKSVALERDELRAKQRARLAAEADRKRRGLREEQSLGMKSIVERLDLKRALADEATIAKLKVAGFRGQNPLTKFLFFRLVLPFVGFAIGVVYIFVLGGFPDQPPFVKLFICILLAYGGFYAPIIYVSNRATKRKESIQKAWPDALDLMLICVESGMSVEAAFRRVADEIGTQSVDLAEEFVLTNAELSFLQERKQAYENLASRTGLDSVKAVSQALVQAERYGTPVAHALRVLSAESRDMRMNAAEKKAAALPPKLTVPMILFFLPVLFAVILGPAGIQVAEQGVFNN
ncbi:type II secretion system F family protein [Mesorhizobium microcysteis]|jgi:tight adherence protein C|uniref:Type II secretion system F family protein n=1 Tax=Neoaquamicrobium microcysteis TaxID=2682781 RepID=A0A5D4GT61_9HYPH|nr:type II secretion system F family protein [Mesorhizobium microcysteis]TYR29750.1 type II secretion system F family protein [Mesorhizobium microcysteis]